MILRSTKPLIPAPASSGLREKQRNIPYVTAVPVQKSLAGSRKTLSNRCLFRSCSTFDSDNIGPHIESDTNHYLHWTAFAARRTPAAVCCLSRSKETCNAEQRGEYCENRFQSIIDQVILEIYSVLGLYHRLWRQQSLHIGVYQIQVQKLGKILHLAKNYIVYLTNPFG